MTEKQRVRNPRVVAALRKWWGDYPGERPTDDDLLRITDGSWTRAHIEAGIALQDFFAAVKDEVAADWRRIKRLFGR